MWITFGPIASSTGLAVSNAVASPPTISEACPAFTVTGLPEIGASSIMRPTCRERRSATLRLTGR